MNSGAAPLLELPLPLELLPEPLPDDDPPPPLDEPLLIPPLDDPFDEPPEDEPVPLVTPTPELPLDVVPLPLPEVPPFDVLLLLGSWHAPATHTSGEGH